MKTIITAALLLFAVTASANTDYTCLNSCLDKGSTWGFCKKQCEY